MAFPATSTLFALFVTFCTVGRGLTAEKSTRPHGVRQQAATTASAVAQRGTWELPVQLDGRPVERYSFGSTKPLRPHRFGKAGKDKHGHAPPLEDVDPEWVNLDGFAVLGGAPVNISSAGSAVSSVTPAKPEPPVQAPAAAVDRTPQISGGSPHARVHRRPPQSSSGPRQLERRALVRRTPLLERRRQHSTKPQSDQRNRNAHKLASESVHVVSLQAQRAQGRSAPVSRTVMTKITPPEPEEYEAKDITVRVMSAQSVLISWVDPAVEMEKVTPVTGGVRYYTVKYREKGESARWEYKESTQRRMLIDTLSADGMYEFSVRITQGENHGKWSVSVFQRTPESAPSGPPEDFEVKPLRGKGTAVIATWEPPEEPNGRIREYILSYAPAMKPFGMKSVTHRGSTTKATIEGLTPGDRYIFKIRATNRRGQGPQSKAFSVVMPGTSGGASSSSKSHASHTPSHTPTKQDSYLDDIDRQSAEVTEEPTTAPPTTQAPSTNRRTRPLSQTRSYHSIFSAVRGSVRNGGSGRGRSRKEEEGKTPTTPPPEEEAVIEEIVEEKKEPDNNVFYPESVDTKGHGEEHQTPTPETPSPKTETPTIAPTKPVPNPPKPPPRRPIKIRVHQKPGSKASSSSSSPASSSTQSSSSLPHTSESQESAVGKKDYTASLMPESKDTYVQSKPSTPAPKQTSSQSSTVAPLVGRGSATGGRISGSVIGSRYGFGRRNHGFLSRWNLTRTALGVKHGSTSNLPSRTQNQGTSNTQSSTSQSAMPTGSQNREKLSTFSSAVSRSDARTGTQSESISKTDTSAASQSSRSQNPTSSHTNSPASSEMHNSGIPQSTSDRGSHNPATSRNTHNPQSSHTQTKQDTIYREDADDGKHKNTESEASKADEQTSSSHLATPNTNTQTTEEKKDGEEREESSDEKPSHPPVRLHPSFAERFPSLASRYPGKFGSGARLPSTRQESRIPWNRSSSSIGAGRPISRGTPTRVSGANGAAGVSTIQETSEDPNTASTRKPLKSGEGASSLKPSLTIRKNDFSESRQSSTSSSSHSNPHHSSGGQGLPVHRGSSKNNYNDHEEEYLYEGSRETDERTEKVPDPTAAPKTPTLTSVDQHKSLDSPTGGRTGSAASPSLRRPVVGANGRVRGRLPFRVQPAQNTRLSLSNTDSSASSSSASSASSNLPKPVLTSDRGVSSGTGVSRTGGLYGENSRSASSSNSQGTRARYPNFRGKPTNGGAVKPGYGNDKNGRPNLTTANDKEPSSSVDESKPRQHFITGPDGTKWIVDLVQGVLMNEEGQVLQDSQGRPNKVVLGDDGRTIFDHQGSPLVNEEGLALFGHGRDSRPVINPKDKVLTVGGKPVLGLNRPHHRTTTATTTTTTTMAPTTTTEEPTTLPPTTEQHIEETTQPYPTCPPGTFTKTDEYGYPVLDPEGILDCYPEDDFFAQTTLPPSTTTTTTTTTSVATTTSTTTTTVAHTPEPDSKHNNSPLSEFDLTGKKRFTAPYVNYIQKDPGAPCSLTEALEYLQVDVLQELMEKDRQSANQNQPPKNKPHNITVVAMEGCHSFVILDWAIPLQDDMVSGYMVHSASYDDILNNRWSTQASSGTHLAVENLKPNSRYYFKVQAKNVFGLGPVSDTLTYVTESDDPLLIERPPGGEPIWIPFTFKYNHAHSTCKGSQYVKRTWYRKFVGVVLCNSLRYKIFMGDGLREPFYSIADTFGQGEDHCQFVDSYLDGRTGPVYLSNNVPAAQGFYRAYRQEPVTFGTIGRRTAHPFVGWYECGVPIPGKW